MDSGSGIILLNKKPGITSFDALRDIKRALGTGKVGHTGTLDKFAQGLLVVLAGRALRLSKWFSHCDKQYTGRIHFGIETDTLDPEGFVTAGAALPDREKIKEILIQFTGEIMQEPPAFSAIHVNGQRASNLARSGQVPQMKKRPVSVYKLELLSWQPPFAEIFVHCSSGTYIRSLARDIALAAKSRAHLCALTRTQVGGFSITQEANLQFLGHGDQNESEKGELLLLPIDKSVINALGMPWFEITQQETKHIFHGKPLDLIINEKLSFCSSPLNSEGKKWFCEAAAVFWGEELIAIIEKAGGKWEYGCVFA